MNRIIPIFLCLFLYVSVLVQGQDTTRLEAGHRIVRDLAASEKHTYLIDLDAKQFVYGEFNQKGMNVVISVLNPEGKQIGKFSMTIGQERFYLETTEAGPYRIELSPFRFTNSSVDSGEYVIKIKQVESLGDTPEKQIDQLLNALYPYDRPGGVVAVVQNGKTTYARAYGMANMTHGIPFTTETASNIGSVSKQFTGFAIALLEKEGKLSLDDDIRKYIPGCPDFGQPVTIRNLLDHTSGYRSIKKTFGMKGIRGHWTREELIQQVQSQRELQNPPGSVYSYSNTGYILLAEVVERVSGVSFREWMEANVFGPLGMENTTVNSPIYAQINRVVPNSAQGYFEKGGEYGQFIDEPAFYGASSIYSTVNDVSKWLRNFRDARVGGPSVISRMTERGVLTNGDTLDYAFGIDIDKHRGLRRYNHSGFDGFHWTMLTYYPEIDAGIIILNNCPISPTISRKLTEVFIGGYEEPAEVRKPRESQKDEDSGIDPALLKAYAGRYAAEEDDRMIVKFVRDGNGLRTHVASSKLLLSSFTLLAVSDSTFVKEDVDISVTFHLDTNKKVERANLRYAGNFTLRRLPPYEPSEEDLSAFAGLYYSPELESVYTITVADNRLTVKHPSGFVTRLAPKEPDMFSGGYLGEYRFERNDDGNVSGFVAESVLFEKLK